MTITPWREPKVWSDKQKLVADEPRTCVKCGCTDDDCTQCIEKTGRPCFWVMENLCSACVEPAEGVAA